MPKSYKQPQSSTFTWRLNNTFAQDHSSGKALDGVPIEDTATKVKHPKP